MEASTTKCRCMFREPELTKDHYFYVENVQVKDGGPQKNAKSRPSSAGSVKSSRSSKKSIGNTSKVASSDSKINKKTIVTKTRINPRGNDRSQIDPESAVQLKQDLQLIKDQLLILTQKRNEALDITNELETRYANLLEKNQNQEKEIEKLKRANEKLQENVSVREAVTTKFCLDKYEEKLNSLYGEFLNTSKIMEENREKFCRCIKKKQGEYHEMTESKNDLSRMLDDNKTKYDTLAKSYHEVKENERKYQEVNQELASTVEELENQLNVTMMEREMYRQELAGATEKYQELTQRTQDYTQELKIKTKQIQELNTTIEKLKSRPCKCAKKKNDVESGKKYEQLAHSYNQLLEKLNLQEQINQKRTEETQALQNNEKNLISELVSLQNFSEELANITNEHNLLITRLNAANQEKDSVIECHKAQLASKDKEIELLAKNEDRLKRRVVQLQEDVVSLRISSNPNKTNVLCAAEDCSVHITEELQDLITALYEEIDKTLAKDEIIQKQNRNICCMKCALTNKERELLGVRKELQMLRQQLRATMRDKQVLATQIRKIEAPYTDSEDGYDATLVELM